MPFSLIHFVTNRCNLRCRHCFIYGDFTHKPSEPWRPTEQLDLTLIEKMTRSMKGHLTTVSLTGGEPLLRSDLLQIAKAYVNNAGARIVEISTNGLLHDPLERFVTDFLAQTSAQLYVSISFDGLKNTHDRNRNAHGAFDKAIEAARLLKALHHPRLQVSATLTVCDQPTDEMLELFALLVHDVNVDAVSTAALRGNAATSGRIKFNLNCYKALNELIREHTLSRTLSPFNNFPGQNLIKATSIVSRRKATQTLVENQFIAPCVAGRVLVIIHADGSVYPCEILDRKMGNLQEYDMNLPKLMRSATARAIRRGIRSTNCFCSFECAWTYNVIFEPRNWKDLIGEYVKLKLAKKPRNTRQT